jgi:hypothetical protein
LRQAKGPRRLRQSKRRRRFWAAGSTTWATCGSNQIKRVNVDAFIKARRKEVDEDGNAKVSNRTINLDVIGLRCVLKEQ